jgi:hypothetical protein
LPVAKRALFYKILMFIERDWLKDVLRGNGGFHA